MIESHPVSGKLLCRINSLPHNSSILHFQTITVQGLFDKYKYTMSHTWGGAGLIDLFSKHCLVLL